MYEFDLNRWIWLVAMVTETLNLRKNIQKIFSSAQYQFLNADVDTAVLTSVFKYWIK